MDLDVDYATTLVAALLLGIGFVLQQYAARQEPESLFLSPRILTDLLRKPRWLAGIACMVAGQLLAAWSIGHAALTLVEPLLTTYLLFALLLAVPMAKQAMRWTEVAGALLLCAGVTLLSLSRSTKPIGLSFGSFTHWPAAAIIAGIAYVAVMTGLARRGPSRAILTGLGAGLVFGIQDALTRQTLEILQGHPVTVLFTNWPPYCLLGAGIVGLWLMQNAFSAAPLHCSLPAIAAGEPVAGIALGIVVFGDRIQISPGMLAIEAGGIAALFVGVIAVARSSAFSGLRKITEVITPHGEAHRHEDHAHHHEDHAHRHEDHAHRHEDHAHRHEDHAHRHEGHAHRHEDHPHRHEDHAHRHEGHDDAPHTTPAGLNGHRPGPDLGQAAPLDVARPRRAPRRPLHGPASGEEGG